MPRYFKFDYDFTTWDDLANGVEKAKDVPKEAIYIIGSYALSEVIKATPVRTGLLQSNWNPRGGSVESYVRSKRLMIDGTTISIEFTNPTYYAGWVEYGGYYNGRFVQGRYYASKVLEDIEVQFGGQVVAQSEALMAKCFDGKGFNYGRHLQYQ